MSVHRACIALMTTLLFAVAAGCGSTESELALGRAAARSFAPQAHEAPAAGSVFANLRSAETGREAGAALEQLARTDEYAALQTDALCAGMEQLAEFDSDERVSNQEWSDFLIGYFDSFGESVVLRYAHAEAVGRANALLAAWDMSSISPQYALTYARACGLSPG